MPLAPNLSPMERQLLERQTALAEAILLRLDAIEARQLRIEQALSAQANNWTSTEAQVTEIRHLLLEIPPEAAD